MESKTLGSVSDTATRQLWQQDMCRDAPDLRFSGDGEEAPFLETVWSPSRSRRSNTVERTIIALRYVLQCMAVFVHAPVNLMSGREKR